MESILKQCLFHISTFSTNSRSLFHVCKSWYEQLRAEYRESVYGILKSIDKETGYSPMNTVVSKVRTLIIENDIQKINILVGSRMVFPWKRLFLFIHTEKMADIMLQVIGENRYLWIKSVIDNVSPVMRSKKPSSNPSDSPLPKWITSISNTYPLCQMSLAIYRNNVQKAKSIFSYSLINILRLDMRSICRSSDSNEIMLIHYLLDTVASKEMKNLFKEKGIEIKPFIPEDGYYPQKHEYLYPIPPVAVNIQDREVSSDMYISYDMVMKTLIEYDRADMLEMGYGMYPTDTIDTFISRIKKYMNKPYASCVNSNHTRLSLGMCPYTNAWVKSISSS